MNIPCILLPSINGQYANQGKLGAAVLGNHSSKEVRCLLRVRPFTSSGGPHEHIVKLSLSLSLCQVNLSFALSVLKSHLQHKLLLYLSQQKQVAAATIHASFVFTVSSALYIKYINPSQTQKQWRGF